MVVLTFALISSQSYGQEEGNKPDQQKGGRVSDEIESSGPLYGGGTGGGRGLGVLRQNPSRLTATPGYEVYGVFHWPSYGKNFYQLGVIDGTGPVKAGLLYTAPFRPEFTNPYDKELGSSPEASTDESSLETDDSPSIAPPREPAHAFDDDVRDRSDGFWGTHLRHRFNLGIAHQWGKIHLGINASYLEGWVRHHRSFKYRQRDGVTFGVGGSTEIFYGVYVGGSVENLGNHSLGDLAPTFYRAGVSWLLAEGIISLHGDYIHRQRVRSEWVEVTEKHSPDDRGWNSFFDHTTKLSDYERTLRLAGEAVVQNLLRITVGYAHEIGPHNLGRQSLAGGLALRSDIYSLSYEIRRPYLKDKSLHQKVQLSLNIKI